MRLYDTTATVSDLKRKEKLQQIIDHAQDLRIILDSLDDKTRAAIVRPAQRSSHAVRPLALSLQLKLLIAQSRRAKLDSVEPRRGPHGLEPRLRQLIFVLGVIWSIENPAVKGNVSAKGQRRGPMLKFVFRRLRRRKIPVHAADSVARVLYSMRDLIRQQATAERQKTEITEVIGSTIVISGK